MENVIGERWLRWTDVENVIGERHLCWTNVENVIRERRLHWTNVENAHPAAMTVGVVMDCWWNDKAVCESHTLL